jgi:hypothetical protein
VGLYSAIREEEEAGKSVAADTAGVRDLLSGILEQAFGAGFFRDEDDFNRVLGRYSILGLYAVAKAGRKASFEKLTADGPYPEGERAHDKRAAGITDEDWKWFRICPAVAWSLAAPMLDPKEKEKYDLAKGLALFESMRRGYAKAVERKLGGMVMMDSLMLTAAIRKAVLEKDKAAFEKLMKQVREKDWSQYYEAASEEFGEFSGQIPLKDLPGWLDAFHGGIPGRQYYFRAAYQAVKAGQYDHGLAIGAAGAKFFPDAPDMADEAKAMPPIVEIIKARDAKKPADGK